MVQHLLPHRRNFGIPCGIRHSRWKRRNVRRRIRRLHAENIRHDPLPASDRRGSIGLRCGNEKSTLAYQALSHIHVGTERDPAELASVNIRDAVVLGQSLIDKRIIRNQQLGDGTIFSNDVIE